MSKTNYLKSTVPCHLCGLPIPSFIVYHGHPLFGTIDHLQPRSLGGKDSAANRAPAHRCCNQHRGTRDVNDEVKSECRELALCKFAEVYPQMGKLLGGVRYRTVRKSISKRVRAQVSA